MFQFPAYAPSCAGDGPSTRRVPPFGHLRINSCLQIPGAFRSLPRPSSLSEAKASSVRSSSLFLVLFCESHLTTFVSCVYSFCLMKLQSSQLEKTSNFLSDYNLFFYLVISLSIVNELKWRTRSSACCIIKKTLRKYKATVP